jgi:hypothetical protein
MTKSSILVYFLLAILIVSLPAWAEEPLLPPALNQILPKITAGLTSEQVASLLSEKYQGVKAVHGVWSGQSGFMDFILDERYRLSVSAVGTPQDSENPTVNKDLLFIFLTSQLSSASRLHSTIGSSS